MTKKAAVLNMRLRGHLSLRRIAIFAVILVLAAIIVAYLAATLTLAAAFDKTGTVRVTLKNSRTGGLIPGANVNIAPTNSGERCRGSAFAGGVYTFTTCPAWSGRKRYKLTEASAAGYTHAGSNSYRKNRNGFSLNVRGRKGHRRITNITVFLVPTGTTAAPTGTGTGTGTAPLAPGATAPGAAQAQPACTQPPLGGFYDEAWENELLRLVNIERAKPENGSLPPLINDPGIRDRVARPHANDLALHDAPHSHTGCDGSDVGTRANRAGYTMGTIISLITENAHSGPWRSGTGFTPQHALNGNSDPYNPFIGYMQSQGHKDNILRRETTHVGIGTIRFNSASEGGERVMNIMVFVRY